MISDQTYPDITKMSFIKRNTVSSSESIFIDSDESFREIATDRNWIGDGSISNPYLITNITLKGQNHHLTLIEICDTTAYFQILNCHLSEGYRGILFSNVFHGLIQNTTITNCTIGIELDNTVNSFIISNNITLNNREGLAIDNSVGIHLTDNNIIENRDGFKFHRSHSCNISRNTISGNYERYSPIWWDSWDWIGGGGVIYMIQTTIKSSLIYFSIIVWTD